VAPPDAPTAGAPPLEVGAPVPLPVPMELEPGSPPVPLPGELVAGPADTPGPQPAAPKVSAAVTTPAGKIMVRKAAALRRKPERGGALRRGDGWAWGRRAVARRIFQGARSIDDMVLLLRLESACA